MEEATALGAELAYWAIGIGVFYVAFRTGRWVSDRTRKLLPGWAAGICVIVLAGLVIGPLLNSLNATRCRGDAVCQEGPTADY